MGIRMDQHYGLNERAKELVAGEQVFVYNEQVTRIYPDGRREPQTEDRPVYESTVKVEESGERYLGMYDVVGMFETGDDGEEAGYPLHKYTFPDGSVFHERLQREVWSSGPCFFLALQNEDGEWIPESLWTNEEIDERT